MSPDTHAARAREMDGLEFLRALIAGDLPPAPITKTLGYALVEVEPGRAAFAMEPGEQHYNPIGSVHGGIPATLLDSAMSCAVHTTLPAGVGYTTLEMKIHFVRAITADTGRIVAEGKVVHRGGRTATAEGRLVAEADGKLLAHGTTTCLVLDATSS